LRRHTSPLVVVGWQCMFIEASGPVTCPATLDKNFHAAAVAPTAEGPRA
jgi:hypothetical protein